MKWMPIYMKKPLFTPIDLWNAPEQQEFARDFPPPRVFSSRDSFIWWWWMFFFKEEGVRKQIIAFWTTKTYPDVTVNHTNWSPAAEITGTRERFTYQGMSTFWMWDGKSFTEMAPQVSLFKNDLRDGGVNIKSRNKDVALKMDGAGQTFNLQFKRAADNFDFNVQNISPNPPPVKYKRTMPTKTIGFDALKIYHANWKGTLTVGKGDGARGLRGSLYMQNITLNGPALPWLWGVFHKDDGSYFTYFTTFIGPLMFRKKADCAPLWDNRFKPFNKNLNYTPAGKETKRLKHVRNRVIRKGRGLPEFEVRGELDGEMYRVRVKTLAKNTYAFERKKYWRNKFFYNEYPAEVVFFEHIDKDGKEHVQNGEQWTGNCEHSWGILLA
jgi:hypothetical protein